MRRGTMASLLAAVIAGALGVGCSESEEHGALDAATTDTSAEDAPPLPDGSTPVPQPDVGPDTLRLADGGACELPDGGGGTWSCCNDAPCAGYCVEVSPGRAECRCNDVIGGCDAGDFCCPNESAGCTVDPTCGIAH